MQRQARSGGADTQRLPGIIDTFGEAFALLSGRVYLILVPILLDLYLWLGAGLSVQSLTDTLARWLGRLPNADQQALDTIVGLGQAYDLVDLLSIIVPTLVGQLGREALAPVGGGHWMVALPWWAVPPVAVALAAAGLAVGAVYLTAVAYLIRGQPLRNGGFWRVALRNAMRMLGFALVTVLGAIMLILPLGVLGVILLLMGVNAAPLMVLLGWLAAMWLFVLLFFAEYAIVMSDAGPLRAIYLSYNVVRHHLGGAVGFIVVYFVISSGVPVALRLLTGSPAGVVVAMAGNAFVATGVVAAAMLFYRDRARTLGQPESSPGTAAGPAR
ncbi:MAG: hypothetical protein QJR03_11035 [Sphaerobacter sp.]|nr:hypothetical protein [Sphaerobacter sp.]